MAACSAKTLSEQNFVDRYGYLRPGTYDINSPRYDQALSEYLGGALQDLPEPQKYEPSEALKDGIDHAAAAIGLDIRADGLFAYASMAIASREEAKFMFSRHVSDLLELAAAYGEHIGLTRDDMSFITIDELVEIDDANSLQEIVEKRRSEQKLFKAFHLPNLIAEESDVVVSRFPLAQPNFVTNRKTRAAAQVLGEGAVDGVDDKIVLIEAADPGFDWIFSHRIRGLVTKYGGANSHMAIRCAEFGVPAAIGCGERLFAELSGAKVIELDCEHRIVRRFKA